MFNLSTDPINPKSLADSLNDSGVGAIVTFEGRVRDHNDGKPVTSLEYEAYTKLALKEGDRIISEARKKYDILNAHCTHRIGHLKIQDIAVWVGVSAEHRDTAFASCRYIIDEIKKYVPIWKKEHYSNDEAVWVSSATDSA